MNTYTVAYELTLPQGYQDFYKRLESYPHCRLMDSYWLIQSNASASEIKDELRQLMNPRDSIFVALLTHEWAGCGAHCDNWINDPERDLD